MLFGLAGTFTAVASVLTLSLSRWFAIIALVVALNQMFMAAAGWCPVSKLLDRIVPEA